MFKSNVKEFKILLKDNKLLYHPGEMITGWIFIELRKNTNIKTLNIVMNGFAKVSWSEGTRENMTVYSEHHKFFSEKLDLLKYSKTREKISQGKHEFQFQFELPENGISSTFGGRHGAISYHLNAELTKPWIFNKSYQKIFIVNCPVDFNVPYYQISENYFAKKYVGCLSCTSGPISIAAQTNKRGYYPGESIIITVEIENLSSRKITPSAILKRKELYFARGNSTCLTKKIVVFSGRPIAGRSRSSWDRMCIKIPYVPPTIENCPIISVDYYVKVVLHIPGSFNLSMHLPIVVGPVSNNILPIDPLTNQTISEPANTNTSRTFMSTSKSMITGRHEGTDNTGYEMDLRNPPAYSKIDPYECEGTIFEPQIDEWL